MEIGTLGVIFTSVSSFLLAIFIFITAKDKIANKLLACFSISLSLWCFCQFLGGMFSDKQSVLWITRIGLMGAILLPVLFLHFILDLTRRKSRLLIWYYAITVLLMALDLTPYFVKDIAPVLGYKYYPQPGIVYIIFAIFLLLCCGNAFIALIKQLKHATGNYRIQLSYVLIAAIIGFGGGATAFLPVWGIKFPNLSSIALPLYIIITIYAIMKHQLLDISIIIRESLVYSILTLIFSGFYASIVLLTNYLFMPLGIISQLFTVFIAVMVFQPLRDRVQKIVDRIFFRGEFRFQKMLDDLSQENKNLMRSLFQADKLASLGTISASLAHEIKNPLASLKGMTQVLEENIDDRAFIRQYQEVVCRQIDKINHLLEKMLQLGKKQGLSITRFSLQPAVREVLALLNSQILKNNIIVEQAVDAQYSIDADYEQICQVLLNLALNAVQSMPHGGRLVIKSMPETGGRIGLEVIDTGCGIDQNDLDKIFDPFYTTKEKGSGLGLAVVYRIIKEHNGDIKVSSKVNHGTKFILWLPIKADA